MRQKKTPEAGASMQGCCEETMRAVYEDFASRNSLQENDVLLKRLSSAIPKYRLLAGLMRIFSRLKVVDMPGYTSATHLQAKCGRCNHENSVIVVSSAMLLALEQLVMLYGSLVTDFGGFSGGIFQAGCREADADDMRSFDEIVKSYVESGHGHGLAVNVPTGNMRPDVRETFEEIVEIGQLWIVAHELAHFFRDSVMYYLDPHFITKKVEIEAMVERCAPEQGEETQAKWAEEIFADAIATETLFSDLREPFTEHPGVDPSALAAMLLCGGIAAVNEVLYRLEIAVIGVRSKHPDFVPNHPPAVLRWKATSEYVLALAGTDQRHLGFLLAELSSRFATAEQIRDGLAPNDTLRRFDAVDAQSKAACNDSPSVDMILDP